MNRVMLFSLVSEDIKITIEAYFDDEENLVIDGYDIGKTVEEWWGDIDYEYNSTIERDNVIKLYESFGLPAGTKEELLLTLQARYHANTCYSEIQDYLEAHHIPYRGFSWM